MNNIGYYRLLQINYSEPFKQIPTKGINKYYVVDYDFVRKLINNNYGLLAERIEPICLTICFVSYHLSGGKTRYFVVDRSSIEYVQKKSWYNYKGKYITNGKQSLHRYIKYGDINTNANLVVHHASHGFDHRNRALIAMTKAKHKSYGVKRHSYDTYTINSTDDFLELLYSLTKYIR